MHDFDIAPMRDKAGVLIRGSNGSKVFQGMKNALSDFYSERGMYFAPDTVSVGGHVGELGFDPSRKRYKHRVYSDMPKTRSRRVKVDGIWVERQDIVGRPPFHGFLNVEYLGKEMHLGEIVLEWDFPQGRAQWTDEHFGLYFDLVNKNPQVRRQERNDFVNYVLRT